MSNILYDFLVESPLFNDEYIEDNYTRFSDKEIKKILRDYREYVLNNKSLLFEEVNAGNGELTIQTESFNNFLPDKELLKQMALYMDKVIINDPVFAMTDLDKEQSKVVNSYLGFNNSDEIDRKALIKKIKYMKNITPMVAGRYIKFIPMSYVHEPPKYPHISYSDNYFSDVLPKPILEWFRKHTKVHNLTKSSDGWICKYKEKLKPGRSIIIDLEGDNELNSRVYFLFESEVLEYNENTRIVEFVQTLPDTPPDKAYFNAWVYQSINKSAQTWYNDVFSELYNASCIGSTYLTTSPFISELLNKDISAKNTFESDIANLVLKLDLPVISNSSVEKIMYMRNNDGEAFKNFRVELRKQLRELRQINDPTLLKYAIENVSHELNEVQVNEVNKKINQVKSFLFADLGVFAASLLSTLQTNGLSLVGCAVAAAKGYKDYTSYVSTVKQNPGYFLWRLRK